MAYPLLLISQERENQRKCIVFAFNLRFVWPPTCVNLHRLARWRLAWTCIHFGRAQLACVEGREGEGGLERARGLINYIFQIKNVSGLIYIQVSL